MYDIRTRPFRNYSFKHRWLNVNGVISLNKKTGGSGNFWDIILKMLGTMHKKKNMHIIHSKNSDVFEEGFKSYILAMISLQFARLYALDFPILWWHTRSFFNIIDPYPDPLSYTIPRFINSSQMIFRKKFPLESSQNVSSISQLSFLYNFVRSCFS